MVEKGPANARKKRVFVSQQSIRKERKRAEKKCCGKKRVGMRLPLMGLKKRKVKKTPKFGGFEEEGGHFEKMYKKGRSAAPEVNGERGKGKSRAAVWKLPKALKHAKDPGGKQLLKQVSGKLGL